MKFGSGFVTDDLVAHEYTHLVTEQTSRLIYQNASGAINESFSDIWGEFMDLSNNGQTPNGNDGANVRWEIGEDRATGALRSMRDPGDLLRAPATPRFNDPDRLSSTNYVPVAINPGAAPDGDSGGCTPTAACATSCAICSQTVTHSMARRSIPKAFGNVATLLYQVQVNYLVPAADWRDLYFAITNAAANLEWSAPRQINVNHACTAVEISTSSHDYYIDRSSPAFTGPPVQPIQEVGIPNVVGTLGPYRSIPAGINAVNDTGTLNINGAAGTCNMGGQFNFMKPMTMKTYNAPTTIAP